MCYMVYKYAKDSVLISQKKFHQLLMAVIWKFPDWSMVDYETMGNNVYNHSTF